MEKMISIIPAIKILKIRNLGIIRKADMKFAKGINIIYGFSSGGKTTILNAIRHVLNGEKLIYGPSHDKQRQESSKIVLEVLPGKLFKKIGKPKPVLKKDIDRMSQGEKMFFDISEALKQAVKGQAILLDDAFGMLDEKVRKRLYAKLNRCPAQIIMTVRREHELIKKANVIRLKRIKGFYCGT